MAFNPRKMYLKYATVFPESLYFSEIRRGILTPEIMPSLMARVKNNVMIWRANLVSTPHAVLITRALPMTPTMAPIPRTVVSTYPCHDNELVDTFNFPNIEKFIDDNEDSKLRSSTNSL